MSRDERAEYDRAYAEARHAADVGKRNSCGREATGLSQRDLAARMGASQAAVAWLEGGGVGATLTSLHRVAAGARPEPSNRPLALGTACQAVDNFSRPYTETSTERSHTGPHRTRQAST